MPKHHKILIIGAGASGLMTANRFGDHDIALLDANPQPAQKIKISGGGRCNITNKHLSPDHYLGDPDFIAPILRHFDQNDLLRYLKDHGLTPILQKRDQYFCPHSAQELITLLTKDLNAPIYKHQVKRITKHKDRFIIDDTYSADILIVASGGLSFPSIGASGIAFEIAQSFGHTIIPTAPALVGLTLQRDQFWMKELSGISLYTTAEIGSKRLQGNLLFAHKGISGPLILNSSLYWKKGEITIDFTPKQRLNKPFFNSKKYPSSALKLPKRFVKAFLQASNLPDKPLCDFSPTEREQLQRIKSYRFAPAGNFGYTKAEVTKGGIATDEIDPQTMMSKKCPNLYFIGESLNVTGELGGYNFQWAFSSAWRVEPSSFNT